jgi:hypothetical protein
MRAQSTRRRCVSKWDTFGLVIVRDASLLVADVLVLRGLDQTTFLFLRAAFRAASLTRLAKSAPAKPACCE